MLKNISIKILIFATALCNTALIVAAQLPSQPTTTDGNELYTENSASLPSSSSLSSSYEDALSANQIDDFLQEHSELIVDLKSIAAEQLQHQNTAIQADSITDEQLFQLIASSASLRAGITTWLQARGYVTSSSIRSQGVSNQEKDDREGLSVAPTPVGHTSFETRQMSSLTTNLVPDDSTLMSPRTKTAPTSRRIEPPIAQANAANATTKDDEKPADHNVTDTPDVRRQPAPYNLLALRDLYMQLPTDDGKLKRFGSDVFTDRSSANHDISSSDLPVGPDYILGSGDSILINTWGGLSQSFTRTVDREGRIALPDVGALVVAGLSITQAQTVLEEALGRQYSHAHIAITLGKLRTVRVYVVGDVQRPGAYELSSLATPLNALYAAGGPTNIGSLRIVKHYRGQTLLREVDLYDFLLHGQRLDDDHLAPGDTLLIPPAGPQVAIAGAVKRPAIYELKDEQTLAAVLADAGGVTVAAALDHIVVDRIQPNQRRETVTLDLPEGGKTDTTLAAIAAFRIKDGDRIHINAILPHSERVIYLDGHVARPGKVAYRDGLQLSDVLHSYNDLLPEPAAKGDVIRLVPPDLHAETTQFDVADVLIGNVAITLQPFDTIRIYGRYEFDAPQVTIRGEVMRPGIYPLSRGMTTAQLVRMAGGFKRDALLDSADLTSYTVQSGRKVVSQRSAISIGEAVHGHGNDTDLKAGDILTIHQISGWNDIGSSVTLTGEVTFPGSYGLQEGERLSSVLRRAGGLRTTAYPNGAVLVRVQVKELEEKSREELIREIEATSASARLSPNLSGQDEATILQAAKEQQQEVLDRLRSQPASGRLVIHISSDIDSWANTPADIELRTGDMLAIPKRPSFVLVSGQVYNASAITFVPGKTAGWYLKHAGGTNDVANNKEIFVVHANGSVVGRRSGGTFSSNVLSTKLEAGDVVVVPQKIIGGSLLWRNLLTVAQITSSIAITAVVAGVL